MWFWCPDYGFFSIVRRDADAVLTVRARFAGDLERLRVGPMPALSPTVESPPPAEYRFRATLPADAFSAGLAALGRAVDHPTVREALARLDGPDRVPVMDDCRQALLLAQEDERLAGAG